jgi:hypothetical protein
MSRHLRFDISRDWGEQHHRIAFMRVKRSTTPIRESKFGAGSKELDRCHAKKQKNIRVLSGLRATS